ncbi:MAG: ABC transporter substrate-binding protein, partial [Candidatus Dormiibacterota bacterium]
MILRQRRRPMWLASILSGALLLLLSACGGGGGSSGGSNPLTVGELFPMSGRESFVGQWFLHGAKAGIVDVNKHGGVMGHKLNASLEDTGGDPVDAVPAWRKLQTQNPTFEVGPSSLEIMGVIKNYDSSHLVDFMEGGTSELDTMQYKYVWRTTPSDTTLTAAMAYYAVQKHYKNVAMFFETTSDATAELNNVTKFYKNHGGTIVDTEQLALHQSSYRTEVEKAFAKNPQAVFIKTDPETASTLFSDIKELGHMNVPFISDDGGVTLDFAKSMGLANASQYLVGVAGSPPSGGAWQTFTQDYKSAWNTATPLQNSQNTYDAVIVAALAMTEAKSTDGKVWVSKIKDVSNPPGQKCYDYADCVKLLQNGKQINYEGATGPTDFNQYHNVFGPWDMAQFDSTGSTTNVLMHVPASAIAGYINQG